MTLLKSNTRRCDSRCHVATHEKCTCICDRKDFRIVEKCINTNCKNFCNAPTLIEIKGKLIELPPDENYCTLFMNVEECEYHDILEPPTSEFHKDNAVFRILN